MSFIVLNQAVLGPDSETDGLRIGFVWKSDWNEFPYKEYGLFVSFSFSKPVL